MSNWFTSAESLFYFYSSCISVSHILISLSSACRKYLLPNASTHWRSPLGVPSQTDTTQSPTSWEIKRLYCPSCYWMTSLTPPGAVFFPSRTFKKDKASQAAHPPRSKHSSTLRLTSDPRILTLTLCPGLQHLVFMELLKSGTGAESWGGGDQPRLFEIWLLEVWVMSCDFWDALTHVGRLGF